MISLTPASNTSKLDSLKILLIIYKVYAGSIGMHRPFSSLGLVWPLRKNTKFCDFMIKYSRGENIRG